MNRDRDYLIENLSMLLASGMTILEVLEAVSTEIRSKRMKRDIERIREAIDAGSPVWRALESVRLFPTHTISLIRIGEESGKLSENLRVVGLQQEKERVFRSKIRSAMMYPLFVLSLTLIIGIGIAWFILPKLATVFSQLRLELPLITKILIGSGEFLGQYGIVAVPTLLLLLGTLFYFLFYFPKTKTIGQMLLLLIPGVKRLIQEVELSRFGYFLGTLLHAGLPVIQALSSLTEATFFPNYKKFYTYLAQRVEEGNSFQKSFNEYRGLNRLIPTPIQQLIISGEKSGNLPETLLSVSNKYDEKTDTTTKNLTVILEPILLVIVWLGVVAVALAVILPIYNLIGGLNQGSTTSSTPPATENETHPTPPETAPDVADGENTSLNETPPQPETSPRLKILPTELGYLNVRNAPSRAGSIIGKIIPGEEYQYTQKQDDWYEIILPEDKRGWIFGIYARLIETQQR